MTLIPLSRLFIEGRSDDYPVALRHGETICFGRFRADVAAVAAKFKACNCAALICQDSYNFAVGFYGLLHAGTKIVLPANAQPGSLEILKNEFDVLVNDAVVESSPRESAALTSIDSTRLSLLFFTSGSTGTPKGIPKSLAMLEREIATLDGLWGKDSGQGPIYATVSHQHIYGLTFKLLWPLAVGRPFTAEMHPLWESLLAELTPDAVIVSSPAHLGRLDGIAPLLRQQSPKRIFSAGAPLSLVASQQTEAILGCRPTEIFGSTETGAFATRRQTKDNEPWHLLPGMSIRSDDESHLVLRSPFVGENWMTTADLIEPLVDGFRFLGRADRIAKIEGKRISLTEVEQLLAELPHVESAAVVVLQDEPNRLAAAIVPSKEGQATLEKIGIFRFGRLLRSDLALTQEAAGIPRLWRFVSELPAQQGLGKHRDADIRALFGDDR